MRPDAVRQPIRATADVEQARRAGRGLAAAVGLAPAEAEMVGLAVTELGTNLLRYAREGEIALTVVTGPGGDGVEVACHDRGPGIADVALALQDGYSTGGGLGGGLPGVRRLMDEFEIASSPRGTTIVARKWPTRRS